MRSSRLGRKLAVSVLLLFLIPTVIAGAVLVRLYRSGGLADPSTLALAVGVGFVTMIVYLGLVTHSLGQLLVRTLEEIQLGTELMATVNPNHRLQIRTGDELQALAGEINRMADRMRDAHAGLEAEVAGATRGLQLERSKLSAVLATLGEGVVVATTEGRILLANLAAQERLGAGSVTLLGRSLYDFVDSEKIAHFVARLRTSGGATERFSLHPAGGAVLDTVMTPFADGDERIIGFVLVLRDVTSPVRSEQARQRNLEQTLREARAPLSSIRSLSESLLAVGALGEDSSKRLLEAIHEEAVRLTGLLRDVAEPASLASVPGRFETIGVGDLTAMTLRRLRHDGVAADAVEVDAGAATLPLRVEASALSGVLVRLLRAVLARRRPDGRVWLRAMPRGHVIQLDAGGEGEFPLLELEARLDDPVTPGAARPASARDIVREHAGEAWGYTDAGCFGFRITVPGSVPAVGPPPSPASLTGAGLLSGSGEGDPGGGRPDFYDFSLLDAMEQHVRPADRARPLDELDYVVLDTETTGLEPDHGDRIVSLAGVRIRGGAVKGGEVFDALVNPERSIPPVSTRLHGITDAMVADKPPIDVVLAEFLRFADGAVLVGHQVWFDLRFLGPAAKRLGLPPLTDAHPVLDTLPLSEHVHGPLEGHDLETVAARFGVAVHGRHSALGDALTTAGIFVRLVELLRKRGVVTLGQAIGASRRVRRRSPPGGREATP
ncbi:MAG TPA: exonuclease domain-containing protein [Methylomirabilota bacterium]|nr:exonuclease domain-containing protein [Methylomirabilota bacterium]